MLNYYNVDGVKFIVSNDKLNKSYIVGLKCDKDTFIKTIKTYDFLEELNELQEIYGDIYFKMENNYIGYYVNSENNFSELICQFRTMLSKYKLI